MDIDAHHRTAIDGLVTDGVLTADQAEAVFTALSSSPPVAPPAPPPAKTGWLAEVAGYLGGGLMLGGLLIVLGTSWENLSRGARIGIVAAAFALLAGAATVIAGGRPRALAPSAQRRVVATLYGIAVAPVIPLIGLSLDHLAGRWSIATVAAVVVAAAGWWLVPSAFGVAVLAAASFTAALVVAADAAGGGGDGYGGVAVLVTALLWAAVSLRGPIRPRYLGLGIAAAFGLIGAQLLFGFPESWPAYTATAAVAVGCLVLYRIAPEPVLVVAAVLGITLAVPEALSDLTDGALSAAYIVLVGGAVLVAGSVVALRLRRPARNVAR